MARIQRAQLQVAGDVHQRLKRLSALHGKSIAWLVERFSSVFESPWRDRMTPDEWERYLADEVSPAEARRIRDREADIQEALDGGNVHTAFPRQAA
jgi:hypothetical protein